MATFRREANPDILMESWSWIPQRHYIRSYHLHFKSYHYKIVSYVALVQVWVLAQVRVWVRGTTTFEIYGVRVRQPLFRYKTT